DVGGRRTAVVEAGQLLGHVDRGEATRGATDLDDAAGGTSAVDRGTGVGQGLPGAGRTVVGEGAVGDLTRLDAADDDHLAVGGCRRGGPDVERRVRQLRPGVAGRVVGE